MVAPVFGPSHQLIGGRLFDSDEEPTSSEEDLEYLRWELQEKKTLKPETMKLLRGIVQMPFKERKNPDRYDHDGSDHDEEILQAANEDHTRKAKSGKVRPSMFASKRLGASELDMMKGLSKED